MRDYIKTKRPPVARIFPPDITQALVAAGWRGDASMIDQLTDELARRGFVRPRTEDTMKLRAARWWA